MADPWDPPHTTASRGRGPTHMQAQVGARATGYFSPTCSLLSSFFFNFLVIFLISYYILYCVLLPLFPLTLNVFLIENIYIYMGEYYVFILVLLLRKFILFLKFRVIRSKWARAWVAVQGGAGKGLWKSVLTRPVDNPRPNCPTRITEKALRSFTSEGRMVLLHDS